MSLVDFRMYERRDDGTVTETALGINVSKVLEIIVLPAISRVPDAHPAIDGLFDSRGAHVPALNLGRWMKMDAAPPTETAQKVIVCELAEQTLGLVVHQVRRIRTIPWEQVRPPPPLVRRRHGAAITGTASIEAGSTLMLIDVEQILADLAAEESSKADPGAAGPPPSGPRVLAVDDARVAREHVAATLRAAGFRVEQAADGQQALRRLREDGAASAQDRLALVITDEEMPRMSGCELVQAIREDPALSDLPVIMYSTLSTAEARRRAEAAGCAEYLTKFDAPGLVEVVRRWLRD